MSTTSKRVQVALVYHFFAHYRGPILEELLKSDTYDFTFFGDTRDPANAGIKAWTPQDADNFVRIPTRMLFGKLLLQKGLVGLALRRDISHIIYLGNPYYVTTWISSIIARLTGKRVLFWSHGWTRKEQGIKSLTRRVFYRLSHAMLLYGERARSIGIAEGFNPARLHVVYNSLDHEAQKRLRLQASPEELHEIRASLFEAPERPIVLFVGRLIKEHEPALLLDAIERLRAVGHEVNVLIVGDGPERAALEAQAQRERLPVHFYGACYNESVLARLFEASTVMVMPGKIGLSAIHALGYGTPVISHSNPDMQMPEWEAIRPGITGGLFEQGDAADLARAIREWTLQQAVNEETRQACYEVVDTLYNPRKQRSLIEAALSGA